MKQDEPERFPCDVDCPKCGHEKVRLSHYHEGATIDSWGRRVELSEQVKIYGEFIVSDAPDYVVVKEHIQCNCELCNYEWRIETL